jgi:hypothetical protein
VKRESRKKKEMAPWIFALLAATAGIASAQRYGPYVSLGPTQNEIISMETVYTPGKMSESPDDLLFLWPGISDAAKAGGDLIQTVVEMTKRMERCRPPKGHWCITPYVSLFSLCSSSLLLDLVELWWFTKNKIGISG